jgi:hypothetical protein
MNDFRLIASRLFLFVFLIFGTQNLILSSQAEAAARACRLVFQEEKTETALLQVDGRDSLKVSGALSKAVDALFLEFGIELQTKNLAEALEGAAEVLRNGKTAPSLETSEKMAKLGEKLLKLVLKLERIPLQKYAPTNEKPEIFEDSGVLHVKDFHRYVESYIDGTALYKNKNSTAGIIGMGEIRHLYSNNSWILGFKDHDMYHLHYSYGHPFYLAINFMASRSINDLRYTMISSLWESIDDTQYGYERSIAQYFKRKRMTPQEGMIYLARASQATLKRINNSIGDSYGDYNLARVAYDNGQGAWKPVPVKFGRTTYVVDPDTYDQELADFINKSLALKQDAGKKKYTNYYRKRTGEGPEKDHDVPVF